jgi:hypothetical protein
LLKNKVKKIIKRIINSKEKRLIQKQKNSTRVTQKRLIIKGVLFMQSKRFFSLLFLLGALLNSALITADSSGVVSLIKTRPQSVDGARKVSGEVPGDLYVHLYGMDEWYTTFWVAPAYKKSFNPSAMTNCLFGSDVQGNGECRSVLIQGSSVADRDSRAWLANYFYLPEDFSGSLSFEPTISTFILDFNLYVGLDEWVRGMYFRVYGPFVHTKWDLNMKENIVSAGTATPITFSSASQFFAGNTPPQETDTIVGVATDVTRNPLRYNKMLTSSVSTASTANCNDTSCGDSQTANGFGEIRGEWGWNFFQREDYHIGLYIAGAAPTGKHPNADFLFNAYVGNGKHWELGGGLTGHYVFWRSANEENHFGIYTDTMVTHLFKTKQNRAFDLVNKPLSRYMSAARQEAATNGLTGTAPVTAAQFQFANELIPVANLTTQDVNVSVGAQVDATIWFNYTVGAFTWDIGYNLWAQTCENISCDDKCGPRLRAETNTWTLRGDALLYGVGSDDTLVYPIPASETNANIHTGTNLGLPNAAENGGVDNANLLTNTGNTTLNSLVSGNQINGSIQPIFLSEADINLKQESKPLSQKVFTYVGYSWDREGAVPFFGVGGEAEFGRSANSHDAGCATSTTNSSCDSGCVKCTVSQWGVWAKLGVSFN